LDKHQDLEGYASMHLSHIIGLGTKPQKNKIKYFQQNDVSSNGPSLPIDRAYHLIQQTNKWKQVVDL